MRLIPRRKRTCLLVLLGVIIVGAAGIWWAATAKSDFERRFGRVELGMTSQEVANVLNQEKVAMSPGYFGPNGNARVAFGVMDGGEQVDLEFKGNKLVRKAFERSPMTERLRRWWHRTFNSVPPV
jgi:hypothetical protein